MVKITFTVGLEGWEEGLNMCTYIYHCIYITFNLPSARNRYCLRVLALLTFTVCPASVLLSLAS